MSRTVREITLELASTGLNPDQMALVIELSITAHSDASGRSKHAEAQARYHARKKSELIISDQNDHTDQGVPPPHDIKNSSPPTPCSKPKRVSRSASIDVPEEIPQSAVNFAVSKGWDVAKTRSEWDRFRNWSLNAGRKHKNLDAAWRNWVTSPFQTNGGQNGQRTNARNAGESAVLAGLARAFGDRDGGSSGPADAEIPRGRFEFDAEPTRRS